MMDHSTVWNVNLKLFCRNLFILTLFSNYSRTPSSVRFYLKKASMYNRCSLLIKEHHEAQIVCSPHSVMLSYLPCSSSSLAVFRQKSKDISWCRHSATARQKRAVEITYQPGHLPAQFTIYLLQLLWNKTPNVKVLKPKED